MSQRIHLQRLRSTSNVMLYVQSWNRSQCADLSRLWNLVQLPFLFVLFILFLPPPYLVGLEMDDPVGKNNGTVKVSES